MTEEQLNKGSRLYIDMQALKSDIVDLQEFQKKNKFFFDARQINCLPIPIPTDIARSILADFIVEKQKELDKLKKQLEEL